MTANNGSEAVSKLFHGVILKSASFPAQWTVKESQYVYDKIAKVTKCDQAKDSLDCLRTLPTNELQKAHHSPPLPGADRKTKFLYGPVIDHDLISDSTLGLFRQGRFVRKPIITGLVTDDGTSLELDKKVDEVDEGIDILRAEFPTLTNQHEAKARKFYFQDKTNTHSNVKHPGGERTYRIDYTRNTETAFGEIRYVCPEFLFSKILDKDPATRNKHWTYLYDVPEGKGANAVTRHSAECAPLFNAPNVISHNKLSTNAKAMVPLSRDTGRASSARSIRTAIDMRGHRSGRPLRAGKDSRDCGSAEGKRPCTRCLASSRNDVSIGKVRT